MSFCLKSLVLLAALPLCVAAMSREAAATDRFDVKVEVLQFYSYRNTNPGGYVMVNNYNFDVDIAGIGRRTINSRIISQPLRMTPVGSTVYFRNIKKPKRKNRQINMSANMNTRYQVLSEIKTLSMGNARGSTERDLFREADHSRDDTAYQTVAVRNGNYVLYVKVTVTEID
jgi:hypothetical protein